MPKWHSINLEAFRPISCIKEINMKQIDTKPLVSVIIPCYDKARYLKKCIDSVLAQSYSNLEVIISNDGDNSIELERVLCEVESIDSNIPVKILRITENYGVSHCRNLCIENSDGVYIFPLDGDDFIHQDCIAELVNVIHDNERIGVVFPLTVFTYQDGKCIPRYDCCYPVGYEILQANHVPSAHLYRKSDWMAINGYRESLRFGCEDWDFNIRMVSLGKQTVRVDKFYLFYRQVMQSRNAKVLADESRRTKIEIEILFTNIDTITKHSNIYRKQFSLKFKLFQKIKDIIIIRYYFWRQCFAIKRTKNKFL